MPRHPIIAVLLAALLLASLPAPPARAQTIGNQDLFQKSTEIAQKALEVWGVYDDPEALERVADIGYRVARHSGFDDMPITFHLIDMAAPNALALPGGQIFVTRGMLDLGLDDDMLASLLGHEIAHVALHHQQKMQKKATLVNVLSQALLMGVVIAANNNRPSYDGYPQRPHLRQRPELRGADRGRGGARRRGGQPGAGRAVAAGLQPGARGRGGPGGPALGGRCRLRSGGHPAADGEDGQPRCPSPRSTATSRPTRSWTTGPRPPRARGRVPEGPDPEGVGQLPRSAPRRRC